ncbi:MAG: hypothetical protein ACR2QG_01785 [Gammaproteobacteria bacterium]
MAQEKVLHLRGAHIFGSNWLAISIVLLTLISFAALPAMVGVRYDELEGFYSKLTRENIDALWPIVSMLFGMLITAFFPRMVMRGRVVVDDIGIRYESRLPDLLRFIRSDWRVRWDEIKDVYIQKSMYSQPLAKKIAIEGMMETHTVMPWQWVEAGKQPTLFNMQPPQGAEAEAAFHDSFLVALMRERGLLEDVTEQKKAKDSFDSDPRVITVAALFIGLILYFVFDQYFGMKEFYVGTPPYHLMAGLGIFAAVLTYKAVPETEKTISRLRMISVLLGIAVALAAHPFLLRLNAITDDKGLQTYEYQLVADGLWQSTIGAPDLIFDIGSPYWEQYETGDRKYFQIRQGGLNFAQVNMAPLYVEQRAFYAAQ